MKKLKSCGIILFQKQPLRFLLMKHVNRYDLPKGHIENGETEMQCALREMEEETGIDKDQVAIDREFYYRYTYFPRYKRFGGAKVEKTLVIFMAYIDSLPKIIATEHPQYQWFPWQPPHRIQKKTIDPLLAEIESFRKKKQTL